MSMTVTQAPMIDEAKLNQFVGRMLGDLGALVNGILVHLGDQLGLYKALNASGPLRPAELARRTGTSERMVREWLSAQAAQGYINYDRASQSFALSPEQALVFADDNSPVFMAGFYDCATGLFTDAPKLAEAFKSGRGLAWHEHNGCLFCGTERIFRPAYNHHLVQEWLPSLKGVVEKLKNGGAVADVGCGHGASTILMAQAFPQAKFYGYDYHPASIEAARRHAAEAGVGDRITFEVATAKTFPGRNYDLVCFFDCLHDMGDPVGAASHVRSTLAPDGTWMIVEPFANDKLEDNLTPVGALFYGASTLVCTPASMAQEVGLALGAQAGEARLKKVITDGGFAQVRRSAETPFNMVLEAKP